MSRILRSALVLLAIVCAPGFAAAEVGKDLAEEMVRKSGLWESLGSIAPQMRAALTAKEGGLPLPAVDVELLARVADAAYAPTRLRAVAVAAVAGAMSPGQLGELRAWYDSPRGKAITAAEEAMAASPRSPEDIVGEGTRAYAAESPERRAIFLRLSKATRAPEALANLAINTMLALQQGVIASQGQQVGPSPSELRAALTAKKPQLMQAYSGIVLASSALTYVTIGDDDLGAYATFLEGKAGTRFTGQCLLAFDRALTQASREFGEGLVAARPKAKT
jgi:hypothetical protein